MKAIKSDASHARLDEPSRHTKAEKILAILNEHCTLKKANLLDIGTGSGHIIGDIAKQCKKATSVDLCDERIVRKGYSFHQVTTEKLPFPKNTFDVVISNHVLEHVGNQALHLSEIHRVLKKGGILYLATPNRWWWKDPHYQLPFITWLPHALASSFFKAIKNRAWDIHSLSYWSIKKRTTPQFTIHNKTLDVLQNPGKYSLDTLKGIQPILRTIPRQLLWFLNPFFPTYLLILKKR